MERAAQGGLCLILCRALVGVASSQALQSVWPEGLSLAREEEQLCRGCWNKVPLPVPQPVICIQMRRKSCQSRPEGEGDLGCGRRGEVTQCLPPKPLSCLCRLGEPISRTDPASSPASLGCRMFSQCSTILPCLFIHSPLLPLLLFLLFPSSSACSPVCPCWCLTLKIWDKRGV